MLIVILGIAAAMFIIGVFFDLFIIDSVFTGFLISVGFTGVVVSTIAMMVLGAISNSTSEAIVRWWIYFGG